jgi:hypothetical protein
MGRVNTFLLAVSVSLLVLVAGLFHALTQHPPYAPQVSAEQKSNAILKGEENSNTGGPHTTKTNEQHGGENAEREDEGTEFWPAFLGLRLKITDSLIAVFTLGLLIFTGLLWRSTDKLWLAGEKQIAVTKDSVDVARLAALTSERALTVVERAFLAISDLNVSTIGQHGKIVDYRININVINSGRTPARNYISLVNLVVFDGDIPQDFRFPDRSHDDILGSGTTIGPQSRTYFQIDFFIQDAIDVFEGRKQALIYGWLEYDDIFSDSARHRTEFCIRLYVYADPRHTFQVISGQAPPILSLIAYHRYNGHDDDCMYRTGQTPVAGEGELPPLTQAPVVEPPPGFQPPPPFPSITGQFQHRPPSTDGEI